MADIKIIDKTGGLTNILPPKIFYSFTDKKMSVYEILVRIITKEVCIHTFDLSQLKEALQLMDTKSFRKEKTIIVFLARHVAGGEHVLIKVTYETKKETFTINGVLYREDKLPKETLVAYASDKK